MPHKPYGDWVLSEWLEFLENRHQQEIQLRLANAQDVAERLNLLDLRVPVITVAGTNGKGSTVAALVAIYKAAGYRVGSYTSPHLLHFNERICVNQEPINDVALCNLLIRIEEARAETSLTYFEAVTLAGLLYFSESALDVIILEVGLGGRLDATNMIDADLAIITTVDLDHQHYLGPDKESIGYEKAGIMRPNTHCVYADESPPMSVLAHATAINATMYCLGVDYSLHADHNALQISQRDGTSITVPLPNLNQKAAAAAIVASSLLTDKLPVNQQNWVSAMQHVHIPGRQQWVHGDVVVLYDVAHNPQAALLLADLVRQHRPKGAIHAIFSGLQDKDLGGVIRPMLPLVDHWYPALLSGKRAAGEQLLKAVFAAELGYSPTCFQDPLAAYDQVMQCAKEGDLIVIYGSFLLVSAIMGRSVYEISDD